MPGLENLLVHVWLIEYSPIDSAAQGRCGVFGAQEPGDLLRGDSSCVYGGTEPGPVLQLLRERTLGCPADSLCQLVELVGDANGLGHDESLCGRLPRVNSGGSARSIG